MKKNINLYILLISAIFIPSVSFAALEGVVTLVTDFKGILNLIIPTLFLLALVYFFWGVGQFILHDAGNDKTREDGKKKILWGIIALFVLASIFGIISWISSTLGVGSGSSSSNNNSSGSCSAGHYLNELGDCVPYI